MSDSMNEKIKKLLRLAERAGTPAEAETASRMAERLMLKWGIEEAMLGDLAEKQEAIVTKHTQKFPKTFEKPRGSIANSVILGFGNMKAWWAWDNTMVVMGFESDVDRALLFIPSILVQADHALANWWKDYPLRSSLTAAEAKRAKRNFLFAFGSEVRRRLTEMRAEEVAVSDETAIKSTALVLLDRGKLVDAEYDAKHAAGMRRPKSLKGSLHGGAAGREAGARANLGGGTLGTGIRGSLGR